MVIAQRSNIAAGPVFEAFASRIKGTIIRPNDAAYDEARGVFNLDINRRPGIIVRVAEAADVAEAVRFARATGAEITVRSGGHSVVGYGVADDAVVIDMSQMRNFAIDPERETVWLQPGVRTADLVGPAAELGLALTTGDASSVGIGGLTLGGGIGWLVRKHGLTIDHLLQAEVVTADGEIIRASADEHADLFWAIRGGGGNFGIITAFQFRMERLAMIYGGALVLPATAQNLRGYLDYARNAPDELTTIAHVMAAPPAPFIPEDKVGELSLVILVVYAGDLEEGARVVAPLRALDTAIADVVSPMPYPAIYMFTEESTHPHGVAIRSEFTDEITDEFIESALELGRNAPSPTAFVQYRPFGGQLARVPADATAFAHRDAGFMVTVLGLYQDAGLAEAHLTWTEAVHRELRPLSRGVYSNFLADEGEDRVREAYGVETYARLVDVKRRYDPENVFHFNQNIKPA
jgi:FAD/FMN-containing dehydrogenase